MPEQVVAIIVAAGSGVRLGGETPKALRLVGGVPLVRHAAKSMAAGGCGAAVVVIPEGESRTFAGALADLEIPITIVTGGRRRQDSVAKGLAVCEDADIVLVHDAARPFVPAGVVEDVIKAVWSGADAVVPVVDVVDSLRMVTPEGSTNVDRRSIRAVQTPQGFRREVLVEAHARLASGEIEVTDDASACELFGYRVELVAGSRRAMKITSPVDLVIADYLVAEES